MSVLTLAGRPIDWSKPPKPNAKVMWDQRVTNGKTVTGSFRTIAHLDHLNELSKKKFGVGVVVLQAPYNTSVSASAGTHDFDACLDVYIPGVPWREQESFFRANGAGAYWRKPPAFGHHIHYFTLPPREGVDVSDDFRSAGLKVGKFVDGGWSTAGRRTTSSQIEDYYQHRSALSGHRPDDGWFPADIASTIFNLSAYITRQRSAQRKPVPKTVAVTWNTKTGRKPAQVKTEITTLLRSNNRPEVASLQEVSTYRAVLKAIGVSLRYRVHQPRNKGPKPKGIERRAGNSTALLIRRNVKVYERGALRGTHSWIGPTHRKVQEGRVLPWIVADVSGVKTLVIGVHLPTGKNNPKNRKAWDESMAQIEAIVAKKGLPYLILGDWNDPWGSTDPRSPRKLDVPKSKIVYVKGLRIDYAVVSGHDLTARKGAARGSDHSAVRFDKTA